MTPEQQAALVFEHVGIRQLERRRVLALEGDDQRSWLNGQVTNDVRHTREGDGVYCLAVNVRGKIMADAWMLDRGDTLALVVPQQSVGELLESFEAQIIMEDVEVEPEDAVAVFSLQGPEAAEAVERAALPPGAKAFDCDELGLGGRFVTCTDAERAATRQALEAAAKALGGGAIDDAGWELARLRAGRAEHGVDFGLEHYPQEAGLKELAVSFEKGCYLGQEVVCTLENRGKLRRRLVRLEGDDGAGVRAGDALEDDAGQAIGTVTSAHHDAVAGRTLALGYVKSAQASAGATVRSGARTLRVLGLAGA